MGTQIENIDYKAHLDKALSVIEAQGLTIQNLQLQILQLKKLVFGSRHEKFLGTGNQAAPTLFNVEAIAQ
jgi:hypothetical protein